MHKSSLLLSAFCPATWISSVPEHLSSDSPFPSLAHCTRLVPFQHSITAAWSPGDVSLLRSDVVHYANRPSRLLLLTRPNPYFSRHEETDSCTQTHKHTFSSERWQCMYLQYHLLKRLTWYITTSLLFLIPSTPMTQMNTAVLPQNILSK